jgi:HK97 family phage prohead protease
MDLMRDLEGQTHRRAASLDGVAISSEDRTMEFSFSSEYPVARYFGNEVLSHERGSVDLGRLQDGAPVLFNHDTNRVIGVVQRAWIDGEKKRGMVSVKFSRNPFAQEVMTDIADGVLRNVSVGYSINQMEERGDNFVATSWQPYEVSITPCPADPTIGIGRKLDTDDAAPAATPTPTPSPTSMEDTNLNLEAVRAEAAAQAANAERIRIASINALTERHGLKDLGAPCSKTAAASTKPAPRCLRRSAPSRSKPSSRSRWTSATPPVSTSPPASVLLCLVIGAPTKPAWCAK